MKLKITLLFILTTLAGFSQENNSKWLDLMLSNYKYPYAVEYLTINSQQQELKMAYMDVHPKHSNGKTIVLFHGKNFNGAYWKTTIKSLTEAGYRVIAPDQIGFGKSSKPMNFQYSFQELAKNTKTILDKLNVSKTAILGHSMGGMLATRFALMYPEATEKLILENPIGLEDWKLIVPYQTIDWWYQSELSKTGDKIKAYQLKSYYDGKWKKEYNQWVDLLAGWTLNSEYPKIAWNAALTYDMIFNQPVLYEFKNLTCPTLLIIGTRDRTALGKPLVSEKVRETMGLYSKLGKLTQQKIKNSELVEIENIGHLPHIESFDAFIEPLKLFLSK
ncbi:alpha/beta fold hydrolase [Wenyingzhuangia sp. 2_MG-2023]|nr:alpha/beta hydrolase [Wenyingzhuangia sp. 2_MG-2023]MDO6738109.1 alpha/beta hydrolase [Wenyingzhuangia sp. 2_MG-2023]